MLNQLNTTTKSELDEKYLTREDIEQIQDTLSDLQDDVTTLSNRVNTFNDTERLVGKFGDDDLYQITIDIGALPNATSKVIATDIVADNIIRYDVFASANITGQYKKQIITIPNGYVGGGDATSVAYIDSNDKIVLSITTGNDRTPYNGFVTIQYTKPTQP